MASLGGAPRMPAVQQARSFLSHFQGIEQVYISMKAAADRKFHSILFNRDYPGTAPYIVDGFEVEGAFTKGGYVFMQDAILHPEPYTSGEEWVLGPATGPLHRPRDTERAASASLPRRLPRCVARISQGRARRQRRQLRRSAEESTRALQPRLTHGTALPGHLGEHCRTE